jgi:hypothetical protein
MSIVNNVGRGKKSYSVKPENLNLDEYKNLLLNKLRDSLEITGFNIASLELELEPNMISHMAMSSQGVTESVTCSTSFVSGHNPLSKIKVKKNMTNEVQQIQQAKLVLRDVHPFVKWAGGKGQLLSELNRMIPSQFNRYFEPFLGGGAMFLHLMSNGIRFNACLSDTNAELYQLTLIR